LGCVHARVLEGVVKSQSPLKEVVLKSQQPCPDTVSLDLEPLLHSGVRHQPAESDQITLFNPRVLYQRSPESGDLQWKPGVSKTTILSHFEGW